MSNDLTPPKHPDDNDGFNRCSTSGRSIATYLKWTDSQGWLDRDGLRPPTPMLVLKLDDFLRRWQNNLPEDIRDKPLPDVEQLNDSIPQSEWEKGIDGKPRRPWAHTCAVYMIDPATGKSYRYEASTTGARIAR